MAGAAYGASAETAPLQAKSAMARLPLRFEANQGRMNPDVRYAARAGAYSLLLTGSGPAFQMPDSRRIDLRMPGSHRASAIEGLSPLAVRTNSFVGRRENWRTGIPTYERVRYRAVYPGVDVVYYGNQNQLEFDFIVQPGADPNAIRMQFHGASRVSISPEGDLLVDSGGSRIVQKRPLIYQDGAGSQARREINGRYALVGRNTVALKLGEYDRTRTLVIDPVINYLTYLGGTGGDRINAVKLGQDGRLYIIGQTDSGQLSAADGAFKLANTGLTDGFLAILDVAANGVGSLAYFTYFGGTNVDIPLAVDTDTAGFVYITGITTSTDFPLAGTPVQTTAKATATQEAFVMKFRPKDTGADALWYSIYLGGNTGNDSGNGITVDAAGNIYVIGTTLSEDFPVTSSTAYQPVRWGPQDTFIVKIDPTSGSLLYSTYLGGEGIDEGRAIAVGANGLVYFAASTLSQQFPWAGQPFSSGSFGAKDVAFGVLDTGKASFDSLVYSSYLGGSSNEDVFGLSLDGNGNMILSGYTLSADFPVTADAMQNVNLGNGDVFVTVFNPRVGFQSGAVYSTFIGGAGGDAAYAARADVAGNIYVTGYSLSRDFPMAEGSPQPNWGGGTDIFVTKFKPGVAGRAALLFSTYVGASGTYVPTGLAVGPDGTMIVVGYGNRGLDITDGHIQGFHGGASDGFIFVIRQ